MVLSVAQGIVFCAQVNLLLTEIHKFRRLRISRN